MTQSAVAAPQFDLAAVLEALKPASFSFDPFGLVSGYKAYHIHTALSARSDSELAKLGLSRTDIPHVAMRAANLLRRS